MKPNYFTYQIHDKCGNIIKQKGILDNQIHDQIRKYIKKIKKKGIPVEVQTSQALIGDLSERKQLFSVPSLHFSSFVHYHCPRQILLQNLLNA